MEKEEFAEKIWKLKTGESIYSMFKSEFKNKFLSDFNEVIRGELEKYNDFICEGEDWIKIFLKQKHPSCISEYLKSQQK